MVAYWLTVRGVRRGDKPNPVMLLYAAYIRWHKATADEAPLTRRAFGQELAARGYKKDHLSGRQSWYLNKYIIPKSAISP